MTTETQVADGWTDSYIADRLIGKNAFEVMGGYEGFGIEAQDAADLLKELRDELTATIARLEAQVDAERDSNRIADANLTGDLTLAEDRIKQLRADNERLRAQVEEQAGWEDVPLGEYNDVGGETLYIEWDDEQYVISLDSFDSRLGSSWVLPDNWRLQRYTEGQG